MSVTRSMCACLECISRNLAHDREDVHTFSEQPDGFAFIPFLAGVMASWQGVGPQTLTQRTPGSVVLQVSNSC